VGQTVEERVNTMEVRPSDSGQGSRLESAWRAARSVGLARGLDWRAWRLGRSVRPLRSIGVAGRLRGRWLDALTGRLFGLVPGGADNRLGLWVVVQFARTFSGIKENPGSVSFRIPWTI
jgi:hypothetical protein